jgi:hypothetical protein
MLPDFDNIQKWLNWLRTKRLYKLWVISPILFLLIIGGITGTTSY